MVLTPAASSSCRQHRHVSRFKCAATLQIALGRANLLTCRCYFFALQNQKAPHGDVRGFCFGPAGNNLFFVTVDADARVRIDLADVKLISIAAAGFQFCHLALFATRWARHFLFLYRTRVRRQLQHELSAMRTCQADVLRKHACVGSSLVGRVVRFHRRLFL